MVKLFYSYHDGSVYVLHNHCPLELLMEEHTDGDGLLIFVSKDTLETVEYIDGVAIRFTTRMMPKVKKSASGSVCETDCCVNEFSDFVARMMEKKC